MKSLAALTSVMTTAAFHASIDGEILEANAPFVQLMRSVPTDDWRRSIEEADRTLIDSFWDGLFASPKAVHQPETFTLSGDSGSYEIRAQAITNSEGEPISAVGVIVAEDNEAAARWEIDDTTGLPEHRAVFEQFDKLTRDQRSFVAVVILLDPEDAKDEEKRKQAARQALSATRPHDMLTIDADGRFLLCAAGINSPAAAATLAMRLIQRLQHASLDARVGLALPNPDVATATLVREAEAGAYASAKGSFGFAPAQEAA